MTTQEIRWLRRAYHLSGIPISLIYWFCFGEEEKTTAILILLALITVYFGFDLVKWRSQRVRDWMVNRLSAIATPRDLKFLNSSTTYLIGCTLTIVLFSAPAAVAGILMLALGDNVASIVGRLWGRHRVGNKSLEGTAAFLAVGWLSILPFGSPLTAFIAALFGALAELFTGRIDDNLTVPLLAALGFELASYL
ncbi:MAG: diacylglycerol/polyprenol kinase family protein [bacterium]